MPLLFFFGNASTSAPTAAAPEPAPAPAPAAPAPAPALADEDNGVAIIDERAVERALTEGLAAATGERRGIDRERGTLPPAAAILGDRCGRGAEPGSGGGGGPEPCGGADLLPFRCAGDDDDRGADRALRDRGIRSIRAPSSAPPPRAAPRAAPGAAPRAAPGAAPRAAPGAAPLLLFAFFFWIDFSTSVNVVVTAGLGSTTGGSNFEDLALLSTRSSISRWNAEGEKYAIAFLK